MEKLAQFFKLKEHNTTVKTELMAGITTFIASAFTILAIPGMIAGDNPQLANAVFIAACLSSVFGTLLKSFYAKLPFVQAPGMGLGSFFAFTVMPGMILLSGRVDLSLLEQYQMGLALVFIAGVIFTLTTFFGIRDAIVNGIPKNIKLAMGAGIGLFITLLGLRQAGIVIGTPSTFVTLVNFGNIRNLGADYATYGADYVDIARTGTQALGAILALVGLFTIAVLSIKKVKGSILIGVVVTTALTYITGHTSVPENFSFSLGEGFSDFFELSFLRFDFSFLGGDTNWGMLLAFILAFVFVNMLDALGTIFGISSANGMVDEKGEVIGLERGLTADAIGTAASGAFGSSTTTTVVSSASGISEGGRTGLTSLTVAVLFFIALFFAPFVSLIPVVGTAPALIYVGYLMLSHIKEVDFKDPTEAFPAFLTIIMMPLTFSIADGIAFGLISYIIIKLFTGRIKEVKPVAAIIAFLFVLQYIL